MGGEEIQIDNGRRSFHAHAMKAGMLSASLFAFILPAATTSLGQAQNDYAVGIVIHKERPTQGDEFAKATLFKRMGRFAVTTSFHIGVATPVVIENANIAAIATFDDLFTRDLLSDTDRAALQAKRTELAQLSARYPSSAPLLKTVIELLGKFQADMEGGQVRFRGGWTSSKAFDAFVKTEEKKVRDAAMAREKTMADKKAAEEQRVKEQQMAEARLLAEKRAAEESKRMGDEKARIEGEKKLAEEQRQNLLRAEEASRYEGNLKKHRQNFAARLLLKNIADFTSTIASPTSPDAEMSATPIQIPTEWLKSGEPLPPFKNAKTAVKEGSTVSAPTVVYATDSTHCLAVRLAVPLRVEGANLINPADLRGLREMVSQLSPGIADWLPLGVVSTRTKLAAGREASISRVLHGHACDLVYTTPVMHDDGLFYGYLTLTIH